MPKKLVLPHAPANAIPPVQITEAEVFILESLRLKDEQAGRFEGDALARILRLCGQKPIYYYFRTAQELAALATLFRESGYRYLHLSCHGNAHGIETTLEPVSSERFSDIFAGLLRNRRLFISACSVGKGSLPELVSAKNRGMYSIACPLDDIRFNRAAAIWASFYARMFDVSDVVGNGAVEQKKGRFLKNEEMTRSLENLCRLFDVRFRWSYHNTKRDKWEDRAIG